MEFLKCDSCDIETPIFFKGAFYKGKMYEHDQLSTSIVICEDCYKKAFEGILWPKGMEKE